MNLTSSEEMAKFAQDVREQETPFATAATKAFNSVFLAEYHRLRASQLDAGGGIVTLNVCVRLNFDPKERSIEVVSTPVAIAPRPHRQAVRVVAAPTPTPE